MVQILLWFTNFLTKKASKKIEANKNTYIKNGEKCPKCGTENQWTSENGTSSSPFHYLQYSCKKCHYREHA